MQTELIIAPRNSVTRRSPVGPKVLEQELLLKFFKKQFDFQEGLSQMSSAALDQDTIFRSRSANTTRKSPANLRKPILCINQGICVLGGWSAQAQVYTY